jgi:hypothetical protein
MEGLAGTAIRSAVRDLGCPQGPGPGWSSVAPVSVRGLILRVAQATTTLAATSPVPAHPGRRVARDRGGRDRDPDPYLKIKSWLPFTGHPAPAAAPPPAAILVKGSWSADRYGGPGACGPSPQHNSHAGIPADPARRAVTTALGGTAARPGPSPNQASWVPGPLKARARQLARIPKPPVFIWRSGAGADTACPGRAGFRALS